MPVTLQSPTDFVHKERVVATVDMPGIPEGTKGKVIHVDGFTWIRYWIRFDNGVVRGSLDRKCLARPGEYAALLERRAAGFDDHAPAGAAASAAPGEAVAAGAVINGVSIPAMLLERSATRRSLLTGG